MKLSSRNLSDLYNVSLHEAYLLLFTDTLTSNIVISLHDELMLHTMLMFGNYNSLTILLTVWAAFTCSTGINYFFGRSLLNIFYYTKDQQKLLIHKAFVKFYQKYKFILLILSAIPILGRFILLSAGFTKINLLKVLGISAIAKLCYYTYIIYFNL